MPRLPLLRSLPLRSRRRRVTLMLLLLSMSLVLRRHRRISPLTRLRRVRRWLTGHAMELVRPYRPIITHAGAGADCHGSRGRTTLKGALRGEEGAGETVFVAAADGVW